jgi:hypothetical protein
MLCDLGEAWVLVLGRELIELDPCRLAVSVKLPHQLDGLVHAFDACVYKHLLHFPLRDYLGLILVSGRRPRLV